MELIDTDAALHKFNYYYKILHVKGYDDTWTYYNKCKCNEYQAFLHRHCLVSNVNINTDLFKTYTNNAAKISNLINTNIEKPNKWNFKQLISNTRTSLRARYRRAHISLQQGYHNSFAQMSKVKAFIKFEKMGTDKVLEGKPARLIQHRSYEYLYLLKSLIGPLADNIKNSDIKISKTQNLSDIFGVGLSNEKLSSLIYKTFNKHKDTVVLCLDHSKWDGHYNAQLMDVMHKFWTSISHHKNSQLLNKLFKFQRINRGNSQNGIKFKTFASRMSGEYTTSIENTLCNYFILSSVFPNSSIIACGDDSLVFLDINEYKKVDFENLSKKFECFGQETKLDKIAFCMEEIDFCQCSPVLINNLFRLVRKPHRLFGRIQYTNYKLNQKRLLRYISGLGLCELASHSGVPMIQEFCLKLLNDSKLARPDSLAIDREAGLFSESFPQYLPISQETRESFHRAFDISPIEQIIFEKNLNAYKSKYLDEFLCKYRNFKPTQSREI